MKHIIIFFFLALVCLTGCAEKKQAALTLTVKNNLSFERHEVVSINTEALTGLLEDNNAAAIRIKADGKADALPLQWLDNDGDGMAETLLFMADVPANGAAAYTIVADSTLALPELKNRAFARFVPERTDDFAWENDKVAFRTYGPKGQEEALAGVAGSTLSNGMDLWLKRVEYPIINKWYAAHVQAPGYYHIDHGEGYDPYHVGNSRGTGGIGIWENDSLYVSQNFTEYNVIADGPLRAVFELKYNPWSAYGVHETKKISLDVGSQFARFDIIPDAEKPVPNITVGLTLHKNEGEYKVEPSKGWVRHWETIDDAQIGEGIVMQPKAIDTAFANISKVPDQSNILVVAKPEKSITYYAGFGWQKSGVVTTVADWDALLDKQAEIIANPLQVTFKEKQ